MKNLFLLLLINLLSSTLIFAQQTEGLPIDDEKRTEWHSLFNKRPEWYQSDEARRVADNNAATATQLGRMAEENYRNAFTKGFEYLIDAQYENGGWPQFYPLRKGYYSHITFNHDAMTGVLFLLKDIVDRQSDFSFLTETQIQKAQIALNKGIEVVLKTQIEIDGKLTGWCAQHDEVTLLPAKARSYELASISGKETVTVLEFLMSLEHPNNEIKQAIISACNWYGESKITGYTLKYIPDSTTPERRNNYSYVEQYAHELLIHEFPEWKKKNGIDH